ncbi:hypothetical protein LJR044_002308 [Microbacterium foliorum]|uniref:Uncharacterized protein n=1 Tax=Microbacterium esteraromaticum TaxID=57043 RepID=A0A1R4KC58_9MICO|nr:hypothetical protein [Microbacterium esteraromaticum]SJN41818.1 SCP1.204c, unknown, len: 553aa [Microbacterium esteraromaticum]
MTEPSMIDFRVHAMAAGSDDGGRVLFQRMLSALIAVEYKTATDIRPDPGDWGIDVMVGSLAESIMIWQSKYFYDKIGDSQKQQIRESFDSAMKHAKANHYRVDAWMLCVACELSAPEKKWWDNKVREWSKAYPDVQFDLWDASRLRRKLMSPDARAVWEEFYGPSKDASVLQNHAAALQAEPPLLAPRAGTPRYDEALFVKQMEVAGIVELDAQRYAFFNADLLVRDVAARAVPAQLAAVDEIDATLQGSWELAVADPATTPSASDYTGSARKLFASVMREAGAIKAPDGLPLRPVHSSGLMHRIVDDTRAGWVHDWRDVAREHAESGNSATVDSLSTDATEGAES